MDVKPEKYMSIPVIREGIVTEVHSPGRVDIYLGMTEDVKCDIALSLFQSEIKKYSELDHKIHYDFKNKTEINTMKWHTHSKDNKVNVFENKATTKENALVKGNVTGYEKIFWFTGINA